MMKNQNYKVTRAHLKTACEQANWDLLDKLLEIDKTAIDDKSLFTDTWGEWWGLLLQCILRNQVDGVRVLLKHGANKEKGSWGDCIPTTPLEAAEANKEIKALLQSTTPPEYVRKTDPELPTSLSYHEQDVNNQGDIRDSTGLVFPIE